MSSSPEFTLNQEAADVLCLPPGAMIRLESISHCTGVDVIVVVDESGSFLGQTYREPAEDHYPAGDPSCPWIVDVDPNGNVIGRARDLREAFRMIGAYTVARRNAKLGRAVTGSTAYVPIQFNPDGTINRLEVLNQPPAVSADPDTTVIYIGNVNGGDLSRLPLEPDQQK